MSNQSVCVRADSLIPGLSCQICNNLLKEATKIYVCFHTFCRKCICDKIEKEGLKNCPICNVDLGPTPMEKLRPDIQLQGLRNKLIPQKEKNKKRSRTTSEASTQQVPDISIEEPTKEKEELIEDPQENSNKFTENAGQGLSPHEEANNDAELQEATMDP